MCLSCTYMLILPDIFSFFFFNDTATTEIYTLSLHDALPISTNFAGGGMRSGSAALTTPMRPLLFRLAAAVSSVLDRKSTRLNSSHQIISYAVFCLKKKKKNDTKHKDKYSCNTALRTKPATNN